MPRETSKSRSTKTNKTSHVLSLLTSDGDSEDELSLAPGEQAADEQKTEPEPKPSRSRKKKTVQPTEQPTPPDEQAIASEIRNALEEALKAEELAEENKPTPPLQEAVPVPKPEPEPQEEAPSAPVNFDLPSFELPEAPLWESPFAPEPEFEAFNPEPLEMEPEPVQPSEAKPTVMESGFTLPPKAAAEPPAVSEPPKAAPIPPQAVPEPPKAAPTPPQAVPETPKTAFSPLKAVPESPKIVPQPPISAAAGPDDEPFCFNVMEALVESKVEKYIDLFGLCPCSRCRTDVVALALTRLPAKYVVATRADLVPLLSTYEGRYNAAVVSQVMRACNRVANQPRHDNP